MALYSQDDHEQHIQIVQRLLAAKWNMTVVEMQRQLERNGLKFDWKYVSKLKQEARESSVKAVKTVVKEEVVGDFMRTLQELQTAAWSIVMDGNVSPSIRLGAIGRTQSIAKDLLNMLFDTGLLKRQLGELEMKKVEEGDYTPLPPGMADGFLNMMNGWGLLDAEERAMMEASKPKRPKDMWWWENLGFTTDWKGEW